MERVGGLNVLNILCVCLMSYSHQVCVYINGRPEMGMGVEMEGCKFGYRLQAVVLLTDKQLQESYLV